MQTTSKMEGGKGGREGGKIHKTIEAENTMYAVLFFPQGFNKTAHKFEEGYLQEDEGGIFAMDRASDLTTDECVNHNFSPRGSEDSTFLDTDRFRNTIRCSPWIFVSQPPGPVDRLDEGVQNLPNLLILIALLAGGEPC